MRISSLSTIAASIAFALSAGVALGNNIDSGIYSFKATIGTPGYTSVLDGSWVKFQNDTLVDWHLVDSSLPAWAINYFGTANLPPLTPGNSSFFNLQTYASGNGTGPDAFSFQIASPINASQTQGSIYWFGGANNLNGGDGTYSALYDGFGGGAPNTTFTELDPYGVWTLTGPDTRSVPDTASTFGLLAGAMIVLGSAKSFLRRGNSASV